MLNLDDSKWQELDGSYRIPYDASIPLKKLEQATTKEETAAIFSELWNELHHQGDVGLASYYAVPHLIRIAKEKQLYDFNAIGLVTTIEIERHADNPELPAAIEEEYLQAIQKDLPELIQQMITLPCDASLTAVMLSALAVSKGQIKMAKAILKMEDPDLLNEFLENF